MDKLYLPGYHNFVASRVTEIMIRLLTAFTFLLSTLSISIDSAHAQDELELALAQVRDETIISGDLSTQIVATFPATIPQVVIDAGFKINSRIILGEALPVGTTVTITRNGDPYLTDITFTGTEHWVTDLFGYSPAYASPFDGNYAEAVETYVFTFSGNPFPVDTTLTLQSILSRDDFVADFYELESTVFALEVDVSDPLLALQYVKDNTTLSGTLAELTATFPTHIPAVIVDDTYQINSRLTLGTALPTGSTVSITLSVDGGEPFQYVNAALVPGTQFWVTDLIPDSVAVDFDGSYAQHTEVYAITITSGGGNPEPVDTTVTIESIISKDGFATNEVLDSITLDVDLPADEAAALQYVVENTTLSGTLAGLTATFPTSIPAVIVGKPYKINSLMTLGAALPAGSTVTITLSVNGGAPFAYVTDVLIPGTQFWVTDLIPGAVAADFDADYANRVELYAITITRGDYPVAFDTTVNIQSIISSDGFTTRHVLAEVSLPVQFADNTAPVLTIAGLTIDGEPVPGDLATGYTLDTLNDPAVTYGLHFAAGTVASEALADDYFGLYLTGSTLTPDELEYYFSLRALPGAQLAYMLDVANAVKPFAYISGTAIQLIDAFQHDELLTDTALQLPDDFPLGEYTLSGDIRDPAGNSTTVTLILVVADGQTGVKPTMRVYPDTNTNYITGVDWTADRLVFLSLDGEAYGSQLPFWDENEKKNMVRFTDLGMDLAPGMLVKMFDGRFTRTHTIIDITVTSINVDTNRVSGTADPGEVETFAEINLEREWIYGDVNSSRAWTVTYAHVDVAPGAYGAVRQYDAQENSTRIYWQIPQAFLVVYPLTDIVRGYGLTPGTPVELDIAAGDYTSSAVAAENGYVEFALSGVYDVQPGQLVVMRNGFVSREHIVKDLGITRVDQASEDVTGTAAAGAKLNVTAFDDVGYGASIDVTADSLGAWLADFSGHEDMKVGTYGYVLQADEDLDYSRVDFTVTHPVPVLSAVSPSFTIVGSGPLVFEVTGSGFVDDITSVYWNGVPRLTTFISETQLSIELSAADLVEAGSAVVRVFTDYYDSGFSTQSISFPIIDFLPAAGKQLALNTVTFDWDDIPGVTKYKIELSLNPDFDPVIFSWRTSSSSYAYQTPLDDGQVYYWRVQPRYGLTWSNEWSPTMSFLSRNPPAVPQLLAPAAKENLPVADVTLEWAAADRADFYLLQMATDPLFVNKTKETLPPGALSKVLTALSEGKYYWRVRGLHEVDGILVKGPWSEVRMFKVDLTPPATPALLRPRDGAVKEAVPAFAWYAAMGAKFYIFEYRTVGDDWVSSAPLTMLSYKPPEMTEGVYEWRVRALDKAGNETPSLNRTVTIDLP